jgi:hypothetical protein
MLKRPPIRDALTQYLAFGTVRGILNPITKNDYSSNNLLCSLKSAMLNIITLYQSSLSGFDGAASAFAYNS